MQKNEGSRRAIEGRRPEPGGEADLEILDLAYGGRGVARLEGFVVFVEGGLPGEMVRARLDRVRGGYAEASCLRVLRASPDRTEPRCAHYALCGGCDLQHLRAAAQARGKGEQVRALLARVAGILDPPVRSALEAGEPWAYRFRMEFDWGMDERGDAALGLHRRGRPETIVPIDACQVLPDPGNEILRFLARAAAERRLAAWDERRRSGLLRRAVLQMARGTGEILLTLETGPGSPGALAALARDTVRRFPRCVGILRREIGGDGRRNAGSILTGRDHLFEEVDADRLKVPAGAFFQPSRPGVALLRREAVGALEPAAGEAILELYCGVGLFTLELARRAGRVTAVDVSREAVAAARENMARAGAVNVTLLCREVSAALPGLLREPGWSGALIDPPRAGLPQEALRALAASGPPRLVYVSCDPGTLARDVKALAAARFRLDSVRPIDLFPHTHHVECVARLSRSG